MRRHALAVAVALTLLGTATRSFAQCVSPYYPANVAGSINFTSSTYIPEWMIDTAIGEWGSCSSAGTGFPEMRSNVASDITISVVLQPGQSTTNSGGCAVFQHQLDPATGAVIGGTIVLFDSDILGRDCEPSRADTIAHEIGHVLGLADSGCDGYIMSGSWNRSVQSDECSTVDNQWTTPTEQPPTDDGDDGGLVDNCSQDAGCGGSPIILDLGDGSYQLTSLSGGVQFDLANDGTPAQMAWTRGGTENAFLALDRNGNGTIDNGAELFGNFTPLRSGQRAANGFQALGELDDNGDGVVNASDAAWIALLLWVDRNHDGYSTPDELLPVGASAVTGLETDYRWIGRRDRWGNSFRYMAHFRLGGASTRRAYYDVFFRIE